ncbi:unnamed protein product, partial [Timema podura]|nr:unnamed protein product [Timema podura]
MCASYQQEGGIDPSLLHLPADTPISNTLCMPMSESVSQHIIDIAINQYIHCHKMEGGNISLKIEPDEDLENHLLQQVKLEFETENNLQVKSEVFLKKEVLSYQTPEFEFVSVPTNHPPIKVEFTTYPNKSGYIQVRSFNNDCFKNGKTEGYSINFKGSKKYTCKQDVCPKWPVKGGYCVKHGGIKTNPNISGCTEIRSFNNDWPKREQKEEYSMNNKVTQLRPTCQEVVCSNFALKGGYCKKHGGLKV